MQRTVIFVAGVHGVGKTFFCQRVAEQLGIDYISASTLIKRAKQGASEHSKSVANVSRNQDILISALNDYKWQSAALLLDGHFCLITTENTIQPIPTITFEQMRPISVILLHAQTEIIQQRLWERDNNTYSLELLHTLQTAEISQARSVCTHLGIPLLVIKGEEIDEALDFIRRTVIGL